MLTPDENAPLIRGARAVEAAGLERTMLEQCRQHLGVHITPEIGTVKLAQLTAPMVREPGASTDALMAASNCRSSWYRVALAMPRSRCWRIATAICFRGVMMARMTAAEKAFLG